MDNQQALKIIKGNLIEQLAHAIAERDQFRAEVDRLRGLAATNAADATKAMQMYRAATAKRLENRVDDRDITIDDLQSILADLRGALEWINRRGGCGLDVHDRISAALARTPAQSLDQVKAKVLRGAAEGLINMATTVESNRSYPCGWEACVNRLLEIADQLDRQDEADRLEKEAANG